MFTTVRANTSAGASPVLSRQVANRQPSNRRAPVASGLLDPPTTEGRLASLHRQPDKARIDCSDHPICELAEQRVGKIQRRCGGALVRLVRRAALVDGNRRCWSRIRTSASTTCGRQPGLGAARYRNLLTARTRFRTFGSRFRLATRARALRATGRARSQLRATTATGGSRLASPALGTRGRRPGRTVRYRQGERQCAADDLVVHESIVRSLIRAAAEHSSRSIPAIGRHTLSIIVARRAKIRLRLCRSKPE